MILQRLFSGEKNLAKQLKKIFFGGAAFQVCENVYEPAEDTFFLAENIEVKPDAYVLDMGLVVGYLLRFQQRKQLKLLL